MHKKSKISVWRKEISYTEKKGTNFSFVSLAAIEEIK